MRLNETGDYFEIPECQAKALGLKCAEGHDTVSWSVDKAAALLMRAAAVRRNICPQNVFEMSDEDREGDGYAWLDEIKRQHNAAFASAVVRDLYPFMPEEAEAEMPGVSKFYSIEGIVSD